MMLNKRHIFNDNNIAVRKSVTAKSSAKKVTRTSQSSPLIAARIASDISSNLLPLKSSCKEYSGSISSINSHNNNSSTDLLSTRSEELPSIHHCNTSIDCIDSGTTNALSINSIEDSLLFTTLNLSITHTTISHMTTGKHPVKKFSHKYCRHTVNPAIKNHYISCIDRFSHARCQSAARTANNNYRNSLSKTAMMLHHIYYLSALLLALCIIITRPIQVEADSALVNAAQRMKLPDSIDVTSSTKPLRVELNGNVVKPGDQIPAKNFKSLDINKITWEANSVDALFTLVLLDLDRKPASGNGTNVYNQFTSFNIPGNSIMNGQSIVAIEPPHVPCQPSLKHRLALLLFHQRESIDIPDVAYMSARAGQSQKRENFKLDNFMRQHRLDLYGANVFHAIGESSGICSGSSTIHSLNTYTHLLVAMVTVVAALGFISGKQ